MLRLWYCIYRLSINEAGFSAQNRLEHGQCLPRQRGGRGLYVAKFPRLKHFDPDQLGDGVLLALALQGLLDVGVQWGFGGRLGIEQCRLCRGIPAKFLLFGGGIAKRVWNLEAPSEFWG